MDSTDTRSATVEGYVFLIVDGPETGGYLRVFETQGHTGRRVHCMSSTLAEATVFPRDILSNAESMACPFYVAAVRCVRTTTAVTSLHPSAAELPAPSGIN